MASSATAATAACATGTSLVPVIGDHQVRRAEVAPVSSVAVNGMVSTSCSPAFSES